MLCFLEGNALSPTSIPTFISKSHLPPPARYSLLSHKISGELKSCDSFWMYLRLYASLRDNIFGTGHLASKQHLLIEVEADPRGADVDL